MRIGVLQHLAGDTLSALRRAGWQNTLRIIASAVRDAEFDRSYGTDTSGYADPRAYARSDPRAQRATFYVATRAKPFLDFLRHSRVPTAGTFVDFGCGKGRALLLAAQHGFQSVTGVEFSPLLCRAADRNIALFRSRAPHTSFAVICGDAGDYNVRPDDAVFYSYDPFDDELIDRCLRHIKASIDSSPRRVTVIYHNSLAKRPTPFDRSDFLVDTPVPRFDGNAFFLFTNSTPPAGTEAVRSSHSGGR